MAGQELKATDKVVLKNSRDGVVEKNLADGSTTRVSGRLTEAVLKPSKTPEQLDKIKIKLKNSVLIIYLFIILFFFIVARGKRAI